MKELKKRMSKLNSSQENLCIIMMETNSIKENDIFFDVLHNLPGLSDYIAKKAKAIGGFTEENFAGVMEKLIAEYRVEYKKKNRSKLSR